MGKEYHYIPSISIVKLNAVDYTITYSQTLKEDTNTNYYDFSTNGIENISIYADNISTQNLNNLIYTTTTIPTNNEITINYRVLTFGNWAFHAAVDTLNIVPDYLTMGTALNKLNTATTNQIDASNNYNDYNTDYQIYLNSDISLNYALEQYNKSVTDLSAVKHYAYLLEDISNIQQIVIDISNAILNASSNNQFQQVINDIDNRTVSVLATAHTNMRSAYTNLKTVADNIVNSFLLNNNELANTYQAGFVLSIILDGLIGNMESNLTSINNTITHLDGIPISSSLANNIIIVYRDLIAIINANNLVPLIQNITWYIYGVWVNSPHLQVFTLDYLLGFSSDFAVALQTFINSLYLFTPESLQIILNGDGSPVVTNILTYLNNLFTTENTKLTTKQNQLPTPPPDAWINALNSQDNITNASNIVTSKNTLWSAAQTAYNTALSNVLADIPFTPSGPLSKKDAFDITSTNWAEVFSDYNVKNSIMMELSANLPFAQSQEFQADCNAREASNILKLSNIAYATFNPYCSTEPVNTIPTRSYNPEFLTTNSRDFAPPPPDPPNLWSRATLSCVNSDLYSQEQIAMRRKAEVLKYKGNQNPLTKKQEWSNIVNGNGPLGKKVWATQNDLGSNPNVFNLPQVGNTLILCPDNKNYTLLTTLTDDINNFGKIVSISGDGNTLAISNSQQKKIYIYTKNINNIWSLTTTLSQPTIDTFGQSMQLSYDGNTLIAGAYFYPFITQEGIIYIYENILSVWTQTFSYSGTILNQRLGKTVSISNDGSIIAIGSQNGDFPDSRGKIQVFERAGTDWSAPTGPILIDDGFISSVQLADLGLFISGDGNFIAATSSTTVRVYKKTIPSWPATPPSQTLTISSNGNVYLDTNANYLCVGTLSGNISYVYTYNTTTGLFEPQQSFNNLDGPSQTNIIISPDGKYIAIGLPNVNSNTGVVYIYKIIDNTWNLIEKIYGDRISSIFGTSLSFNNDGSTLVIGASSSDAQPGKAYIYFRNEKNIICAPSSASDVPGNSVLCYDPAVPLVNYLPPPRTYLAGGTKWPQSTWKPGDNGFPRGKKGSMSMLFQ
jgi:hypothetical protein